MWSPICHDWVHHVAGDSGEEKPLSRTSKLYFETLLYFSSPPDGSPDYVTSVSVSEQAMHLPPVYVDGQIQRTVLNATLVSCHTIPYIEVRHGQHPPPT